MSTSVLFWIWQDLWFTVEHLHKHGRHCGVMRRKTSPQPQHRIHKAASGQDAFWEHNQGVWVKKELLATISPGFGGKNPCAAGDGSIMLEG